MTSIALAEELLLLAYDDQTGKATGSRIGLDLGMAAAVLVDLALAGRVAYVDGYLKVIDNRPIGDPIADAVLAKAAEDEPHTPAQWLQRLRHRLRTRVLEDLCARGVVQDVDETQQGFIHVHRYPTTDPAFEAEIRSRLAKALTSDGPTDERTAALATLLVATRMEPALRLPAEESARAHERLEQIAAGAGFSGSANLEDSIVRPSVALVVATLGRAITAALGAPKPA
ncbi:GOLPH3/VPS74 family protein [Paractinoplanes atraurantiacus]|uniref:Golgi phosphoprotein 3 (GPP34) n=1 Tax=Paractinoplanes atraurantiacus TaxID=1036182 RepID=A0A285F3W7_9ACTN|nr:GPP34 family phosphoprotein [Actinoplanes atraurantiacus]SNY05952.1 Golgi phosphoprotein 3 (GPP34) [Actinoplanes atraurantiacus]